MKFVDLHVHTTASDGTLAPAEVVRYAGQKQLAAIAITDHDTIDGVGEAMGAARGAGVEVVPGVEVACMYGDTEIHMLGLMIDWNDARFARRLADVREKREGRNEKMVEKMRKDGIPITMEKLSFGEETVVTRAHFARFLQEEGYVKEKGEAFQKYIGIGCPYYIPREYIAPEEAIRWIREAGGLSFLAHPYLYRFSEGKVKEMIKSLGAQGMDGVEAYHPSADGGQTAILRSYASEFDLLVSGGSDFHGANKPDVDLGRGRGSLKVTVSVYRKLKERQRLESRISGN